MDHILGGAANPERAALHGIGPRPFRPARYAAGDFVTELKQGLAQPIGHSVEATASMCWLQFNGVVPNDTKVVRQLHGKAPPQGRGFRRYGGRWWGGDDVFLVVLHRAFTMAWLVG